MKKGCLFTLLTFFSGCSIYCMDPGREFPEKRQCPDTSIVEIQSKCKRFKREVVVVDPTDIKLVALSQQDVISRIASHLSIRDARTLSHTNRTLRAAINTTEAQVTILAKQLIVDTHDPIGFVIDSAQGQGEITLYGVRVPTNAILRKLINIGADINKIPDYIHKFCNDDSDYNLYILPDCSTDDLILPDGLSWSEEQKLDSRAWHEVGSYFDQFATPEELLEEVKNVYDKNPADGIIIHLRDPRFAITADVINSLASFPIVSFQVELADNGGGVGGAFPDGFACLSQLVHLRELVIQDCGFDTDYYPYACECTFPANLCNLSQLRALIMIHCGFNSIPSEIGRLKKLCFLDLSHNPITEIPATLGQLSKLRMLCIELGSIQTVPAEIDNLRLLQFLAINGGYECNTPLSNLPASIGRLENLRWLIVCNNSLNFIPHEINQLRHLHYLHLQGNPNLRIRHEVSELPELMELLVDENDNGYIDFATLERMVYNENFVFSFSRDSGNEIEQLRKVLTARQYLLDNQEIIRRVQESALLFQTSINSLSPEVSDSFKLLFELNQLREQSIRISDLAKWCRFTEQQNFMQIIRSCLNDWVQR